MGLFRWPQKSNRNFIKPATEQRLGFAFFVGSLVQLQYCFVVTKLKKSNFQSSTKTKLKTKKMKWFKNVQKSRPKNGSSFFFGFQNCCSTFFFTPGPLSIQVAILHHPNVRCVRWNGPEATSPLSVRGHGLADKKHMSLKQKFQANHVPVICCLGLFDSTRGWKPTKWSVDAPSHCVDQVTWCTDLSKLSTSAVGFVVRFLCRTGFFVGFGVVSVLSIKKANSELGSTFRG